MKKVKSYNRFGLHICCVCVRDIVCSYTYIYESNQENVDVHTLHSATGVVRHDDDDDEGGGGATGGSLVLLGANYYKFHPLVLYSALSLSIWHPTSISIRACGPCAIRVRRAHSRGPGLLLSRDCGMA